MLSSPDQKRDILHDCKNNQQDWEIPQSAGSTSDLKELIEPDDADSPSSLKSASFNYINSIIGSGIIGIPFAFQEAGFGLGLFLLLLVAVITDYSLVLMIRGGHLAGVFTYQGLMEASFGRAGYVLLTLLQFIYPFIAMISYNVVVGDTVTKVLIRMFKLEKSSLLAHREINVGLATILITLPLCLYRDIGKLAKVSLFSLVCVGFILVAVVLKFFMLFDVVPRSSDAWNFANWNIIPAIGIMTFENRIGDIVDAAVPSNFTRKRHIHKRENYWSDKLKSKYVAPDLTGRREGIDITHGKTLTFMCHHNTFLIYGSIEKANQRRWDKVTHISLLTSFLLAALFGISGYATFTGYSEGDLLENYCPDDDLINAARIFFSITIMLTYPIECFVTREVVEDTLLRNANESFGLVQNKHFIMTTGIVAAAYFISMSTDCLGIVLELNGILAAVPLAYILPGMCYLKLDTSPLLSKAKMPALLLVLFGLAVAFFGLISLITDYKNIGNCSHGKIMDYCFSNVSSPY